MAQRSGNGHVDRPVTRQEFSRLAKLVEDLEDLVARNRRDLDVQFQRLADLQAVIDRIQIGNKKHRARRAGGD